MPVAPRKRCTAPGCGVSIPRGRQSRCPKHAGHVRAQRDGWHSLYGGDWPRRRLEYLEAHPRCALCPRMARIPDHWPVPLRRLLERGVVNPHHDRYLRPLCWPCHSRQTAKHQPGGFVAQRL